MKPIYFIIQKTCNHQTIINDGGGASELLFYMTALQLSNYFNIIIYNKEPNELCIDNIQYKYLPDNNNPNIENIQDSVIIVQRHFDVLIELHKINPSNKYILWSHDYLEYNSHLTGKYSYNEINKYFNTQNIQIISVSNFHKSNILSRMPNLNIKVIYNALFSDLYKKNADNIVNNNHIIFASSWSKGLNNVLNIGKEYYKMNPNFKLLLLKPSYCSSNINVNKYPFVECIGNIKNKDEYCRIMQSCLCVLTTSYQETFGCVFAEALHLGVPVLGDNSLQTGFQEIIEKEYMCNFTNPNEVIQKIEEIKNNRPIVELNSKFYSDIIMEEWKELLDWNK